MLRWATAQLKGVLVPPLRSSVSVATAAATMNSAPQQRARYATHTARGTSKYYGVQDGSECFCSNSYGTTGKKTSDGDCNMPCQGNSSEICGGNSHNSVYVRGNCRPL